MDIEKNITPFLKEALTNFKKNSTLVLLNQKQLKPSINFTLNTLVDEKIPVIFISTQNYQNFFQKEIPENVFIVNVSNEKNLSYEKKEQVYNIDNPSNLTAIQIAIETFLKKNQKETLIFFDSINYLSIHTSQKNISRFFYIFINKTSLQNHSLILFAIKESINESILETIKQFCGRTFDYSKVFISSIELEH